MAVFNVYGIECYLLRKRFVSGKREILERLPLRVASVSSFVLSITGKQFDYDTANFTIYSENKIDIKINDAVELVFKPNSNKIIKEVMLVSSLSDAIFGQMSGHYTYNIGLKEFTSYLENYILNKSFDRPNIYGYKHQGYKDLATVLDIVKYCVLYQPSDQRADFNVWDNLTNRCRALCEKYYNVLEWFIKDKGLMQFLRGLTSLLSAKPKIVFDGANMDLDIMQFLDKGEVVRNVKGVRVVNRSSNNDDANYSSRMTTNAKNVTSSTAVLSGIVKPTSNGGAWDDGDAILELPSNCYRVLKFIAKKYNSTWTKDITYNILPSAVIEALDPIEQSTKLPLEIGDNIIKLSDLAYQTSAQSSKKFKWRIILDGGGELRDYYFEYDIQVIEDEQEITSIRNNNLDVNKYSQKSTTMGGRITDNWLATSYLNDLVNTSGYPIERFKQTFILGEEFTPLDIYEKFTAPEVFNDEEERYVLGIEFDVSSQSVGVTYDCSRSFSIQSDIVDLLNQESPYGIDLDASLVRNINYEEFMEIGSAYSPIETDSNNRKLNGTSLSTDAIRTIMNGFVDLNVTNKPIKDVVMNPNSESRTLVMPCITVNGRHQNIARWKAMNSVFCGYRVVENATNPDFFEKQGVKYTDEFGRLQQCALFFTNIDYSKFTADQIKILPEATGIAESNVTRYINMGELGALTGNPVYEEKNTSSYPSYGAWSGYDNFTRLVAITPQPESLPVNCYFIGDRVTVNFDNSIAGLVGKSQVRNISIKFESKASYLSGLNKDKRNNCNLVIASSGSTQYFYDSRTENPFGFSNLVTNINIYGVDSNNNKEIVGYIPHQTLNNSNSTKTFTFNAVITNTEFNFKSIEFDYRIILGKAGGADWFSSTNTINGFKVDMQIDIEYKVQGLVQTTSTTKSLLLFDKSPSEILDISNTLHHRSLDIKNYIYGQGMVKGNRLYNDKLYTEFSIYLSKYAINENNVDYLPLDAIKLVKGGHWEIWGYTASNDGFEIDFEFRYGNLMDYTSVMYVGEYEYEYEDRIFDIPTQTYSYVTKKAIAKDIIFASKVSEVQIKNGDSILTTYHSFRSKETGLFYNCNPYKI